MDKLCIEELDIAFIHASTCQIRPPKEDSTYGMLGDRVVYCFLSEIVSEKSITTMLFDAPFIFF